MADEKTDVLYIAITYEVFIKHTCKQEVGGFMTDTKVNVLVRMVPLRNSN